MRSLSQIVDAALSEGEANIKLASAVDAETLDPGDFLASELSMPKAEEDKPSAKEDKPEEAGGKTASRQQVLDDATYGMKLASALETAAGVITDLNSKVATQHTQAPGPEVTRSGHLSEMTIQPKAQTNSVPANQASHGGGPIEQTQGNPQGIQTNKADYASPDWTKNKEAAERMIRAKVAQAEQLEANGQIDAAFQALKEAQAIETKLAADPSSPQANMPAHSESFKLDTEPGPASHVPDNAGMASATKSSLKDKSQREAGEFMSEKAKKDNAVQAHVGMSTGLKLSSDGTKIAAAREYLKKVAAKANDPNATPREREKASSLLTAVREKIASKNLTPEELLNA